VRWTSQRTVRTIRITRRQNGDVAAASFWLTRRRMRTRKDKKTKTYNRRDSQMVTHSSTSHPVQCLCMAERTGCPVLTDLWSYVLGMLQTCFQLIFRSQAVRLLVSTEWRGPGGGSVLLVPRSDRNLQCGIHTPERLRKGNRLKGHWSRNLNVFFMVKEMYSVQFIAFCKPHFPMLCQDTIYN
jgi:hypothetical protein